MSNSEKYQELYQSSDQRSHSFLKSKRLDFFEDTYEFSDGSTRLYHSVKHNGGCFVIPILDADRVVLVKQYRPTVSEILFEFPGGLIDESDGDPSISANRELREETGYEAKKLTPLPPFLLGSWFYK